MYQFPSSVSLDFIVLPSVSLSLEPSRMFQYLYIAALLSVDALSLIICTCSMATDDEETFYTCMESLDHEGCPGSCILVNDSKTEEDSIITGSSLSCSHLGHTTGGIQADHSLGLSDSRCFSLLSSTRTDKIESESYASDENIGSVHPGVSRILDSLTEAQACLGSWLCRC